MLLMTFSTKMARKKWWEIIPWLTPFLWPCVVLCHVVYAKIKLPMLIEFYFLFLGVVSDDVTRGTRFNLQCLLVPNL